MGLDLIVEACAKPGHDAEWRSILARGFAGEEPSEAEIARFREISIPPYERLGAPRVGYDKAADDWIIKARGASTSDEAAAVLQEFHGHYALPLVKCDGLPIYSNANLYEGVDETSFRGAFLSDCASVLRKDLIELAWGHKFPEEAVDYGRTLLAAADAGASDPVATAPAKVGLLARLGFAKQTSEPVPVEEQLEIIRAAGRWFVFWGERGHAIRAWF